MNNTSDTKTILLAWILVAQTWLKNVEPLENLGVEHLLGQRIEDPEQPKIVTDDGEFPAKTVVIAISSNHRPLNVQEEELNSRVALLKRLWWSFRDENLLVVGGGDSAVEEAVFLMQLAKQWLLPIVVISCVPKKFFKTVFANDKNSLLFGIRLLKKLKVNKK